MHYHPSGTAETDVTRIGLHFMDEQDVEKQLANLWILNTGFRIPAGEPYHEVTASYTINQDGFILAFGPHMHYRGKDFTYTATYPGGTQEILLKVENYDFNWQTRYEFKERLPIQKGTRIDCVAHFDKSKNNLTNPDQTKTVQRCTVTWTEIMIGWLTYMADKSTSSPE